MSLTRKMLKAMSIEDEKIEQIIEAHLEPVNALKEEVDKYKADAEKLEEAKKEIETLKKRIAKNGDEEMVSKAEYDKVKKDFDDYKEEIANKQAKEAKEKAVRTFYESKGITGKNLEIAMRGSRAEIDGIELDGDKIKDNSALDALVKGDFSSLVATTTTKGANIANPPANSGGAKLTKEDIYKKDEKGRYVMSASERQKALAENQII